MEYKVLGPLEVRHGGRPIRIGGPQQRALLAALLLNAGRVVSVDRLVELLWPQDPPSTSRELLRGCVARLRRVLRADGSSADEGPLLTRAPGYLLRVGPGELDADRFAELVAAAGDHPGTNPAGLLREALSLWRGPALADIALPGIRAVAEGLDERMVAVLEQRIDLDIASGRYDGLAGELSGLVRAHPLRERMWAQLMLVRCAAQRPGEALGTYRDLRRTLVEQLGVEPSEPLRRLERAILAEEDVFAVYRAELAPRWPDQPAKIPGPGAAGRSSPTTGRAVRREPDPPSPPPRPVARRSTIVGRVAELAAARAALAGFTGGFRLLGIAGDPGIGKSRLLAELADDAHDAGQVVLAGRAAEFEQEVPFGVFRNALEDHLKALHPARFADLTADERRLLPTLFPSLPRTPDDPDPQPRTVTRHGLHRAVRALLELVAEPTGLVLVLDDLHWCDEGSAELLGHLMRNPPGAPLLLAVAYRPRQLPTRLHHEIDAAARRGTAVLVDVGPLSFEDAAALLPGDLTPQRRRELYEASGGNPFYLELLGRSGSPGRLTAGADALAPASVRAALAGEFAALPEARQRVAYAAAVAGDVFDARLVAAIAEAPDPAVLDALDELSARDLIRPDGAGFRFRHPLLRSAAYHHAQPGWRVGAHGRAAAELERRGAALAERARHVELSAVPGDLGAVELLGSAAAATLHATPAAAARWLGAALRLLPELPQSFGQRLELLYQRARALGIIGHLADSRDIFAEVLRMLPIAVDQRVAVLAYLATLEHLLGNHTQARALLNGELARQPDQRGLAAAYLRVAGVVGGVMHGDMEPEDVLAAIDGVRAAGDRSLLASALSAGAVVCGAFDVASQQVAEWMAEATRLVEAMPAVELAQRLDAALFLGWAEMNLERFDVAADHLDRALMVARDTGQGLLTTPLQAIIGGVQFHSGQLRQAAATLDDALESATLTAGVDMHRRLLIYRSYVSVWTGDTDAATALAEQAVALAGDSRATRWPAGPAEASLGFVRYAAGDPDGCLDVMLGTGKGPDLPAVSDVWRPHWLETLSAAATASGRHREAADFADRAGRLSVAGGLGRRTGVIRLAQLHPLLRTHPADAVRLAVQAVGLFGQAGDRLGAAQARLYAGVAHRRLGDADAAEREIAGAWQAFAACGAAPHWLAGYCADSLP